VAPTARTVDDTDLRLLAQRQRDATVTAQELGDRLNLSPGQATRRRQRLEAEGTVAGITARLDSERLGLKVQALIEVQMAAHSPDATSDFARLLATLHEVAAAWTIPGQSDYLLRVWCADLAKLNRLVHGSLLPHPSVARVQSQIVMDLPKPESGLPL
jgi:DNA-binding Lrp family transcriptional regulator